MRIRKNRTSSRVIPEFCVTHVEKVETLKHVDAAKCDPAPLLVVQHSQKEKPPIRKQPQSQSQSLPLPQPQQQQQPLDVDMLELDAAAILSSLDNESSSYKIRDFVLAQGDNARAQGGGSENNLNYASRRRQSGSESDTGHAAGSRKRSVKHAADARSSKSTSVSGGDKVRLSSCHPCTTSPLSCFRDPVTCCTLPPQPLCTYSSNNPQMCRAICVHTSPQPPAPRQR